MELTGTVGCLSVMVVHTDMKSLGSDGCEPWDSGSLWHSGQNLSDQADTAACYAAVFAHIDRKHPGFVLD